MYPGAGSNYLGVLFVPPREMWFAADIKGLVIFGGNVLNLGGLVSFTDCHFFTLAPTAVRVGVVVGGDILTVAGVTVSSGCTHTQISFASVGTGIAGLFSTVLGGVAVSTGVVYNRNIALNFGAGAGIMTHVGGGVGIYSGCIFNTQGGLFSMFGSSVKQFLGAGVLINSGVIMNKNFGTCFFAFNHPLTHLYACLGLSLSLSLFFSMRVRNASIPPLPIHPPTHPPRLQHLLRRGGIHERGRRDQPQRRLPIQPPNRLCLHRHQRRPGTCPTHPPTHLPISTTHHIPSNTALPRRGAHVHGRLLVLPDLCHSLRVRLGGYFLRGRG